MLPVDWSEVGAVGATNASPITVPGIISTDILLAVAAWDPAGGDPIGIDVSEGTVGSGTVTLSTTDTSDMQVWVIWAPARA